MASVKPSTATTPPRTVAPADRPPGGVLKPAAAVWARTAFVGHTFRAMVTPPLSWRGEFADQAWMMLKRVFIPALIVGFVFGYEATGIQLMSIVEVFGDISRAGRIVHTANFREQAIWNTGLVVAGVLGTAITADLGARKVRDELAALEVMGVDVIRKLVVPRVLAITLLTPIASTLVIIGEYYGDFPAFKQFGGDVNVFAQAARAFNPVDAFIYPIRSLVLGLILGIVSAYEGLNASGGARGVGRAVNRAVVIGFALVLVWDWASTSVYVTLFNAETLV